MLAGSARFLWVTIESASVGWVLEPTLQILKPHKTMPLQAAWILACRGIVFSLKGLVYFL